MFTKQNLRITRIILLLILLQSWVALNAAEPCSVYSAYHYKVGNTLYTTADIGLRVRSTPGVNGKKISSLPLNTKVNVLDIDPKIVEIGNLKSCWFKVSFSLGSENMQNGWVYGAYLQKYSNNEAEDLVLENEQNVIRNGPMLEFYDNQKNVTVSLLDRWDEAFLWEYQNMYVSFQVHQVFDDGVAVVSKYYNKPESGCCGGSFILVNRHTGEHTPEDNELVEDVLSISPQQNYIFAGGLGSGFRGGGFVYIVKRSGINLASVFEDDDRSGINAATFGGSITSKKWLNNEKLSIVIEGIPGPDYSRQEKKTMRLVIFREADGTWQSELTDITAEE